MFTHAGLGRYDVEVNGKVVGRAVQRPEGWEATGSLLGIDVKVHGHESLESAVMAVGRALMDSGDPLKAQVNALRDAIAKVLSLPEERQDEGGFILRNAMLLAPVLSLAGIQAAAVKNSADRFGLFLIDNQLGHPRDIAVVGEYFGREVERIRQQAKEAVK
jgi:hypothetical protein